MPVAVSYDVDGAKEVQHRLLGMAERAVALEPVLHSFADDLRKITEGVFEDQGRPGWEALAPATVARRGSAEPILRDTDRLFDALTQGGADSIAEVHGDELIFGASTPYLGYLRSGTSRMPARDPLPPLRETDLRVFTKTLQAYLVAGERGEFGAGAWGMASLDPFGL